MSKHPIQPLEDDGKGVLRFKSNAIVKALLDHGQKTGMGLNEIATMEFSREDREQLAQLIGYSHSGAHDLGYVSSEVLDAAESMFNQEQTECEARLRSVQSRLDAAMKGMREGAAELYGIHPDDLMEVED